MWVEVKGRSKWRMRRGQAPQTENVPTILVVHQPGRDILGGEHVLEREAAFGRKVVVDKPLGATNGRC